MTSTLLGLDMLRKELEGKKSKVRRLGIQSTDFQAAFNEDRLPSQVMERKGTGFLHKEDVQNLVGQDDDEDLEEEASCLCGSKHECASTLLDCC